MVDLVDTTGKYEGGLPFEKVTFDYQFIAREFYLKGKIPSLFVGSFKLLNINALKIPFLELSW